MLRVLVARLHGRTRDRGNASEPRPNPVAEPGARVIEAAERMRRDALASVVVIQLGVERALYDAGMEIARDDEGLRHLVAQHVANYAALSRQRLVESMDPSAPDSEEGP